MFDFELNGDFVEKNFCKSQSCTVSWNFDDVQFKLSIKWPVEHADNSSIDQKNSKEN